MLLISIISIYLFLIIDFTKPILFKDILANDIVMQYHKLIAISLFCFVVGLCLYLYLHVKTRYNKNIPLPQLYEEISHILLKFPVGVWEKTIVELLVGITHNSTTVSKLLIGFICP